MYSESEVTSVPVIGYWSIVLGVGHVTDCYHLASVNEKYIFQQG